MERSRLAPGSRPRLLVVDDDAELLEMLVRLLEQEGWQVEAAASSAIAEELLARAVPDVVILDLMLPDGFGLDLCRAWRNLHPGLGILVLTARGDPMDRVLGLELGADDYLPKPFDRRELVARVRALMRRQPGAGRGAALLLSTDGLQLDLARREVSFEGQTLALSNLEFKLLCELVRARGTVLGRERLSAAIQPGAYQPLDRTVDVQIARLRRRLDQAWPGNDWIRTARGEGYLYAAGQPAVQARRA